MNTYEINEHNEVVPYTSGRRCTDTRAWRDATELELQQHDELARARIAIDALCESLNELKKIVESGSDHGHGGDLPWSYLYENELKSAAIALRLGDAL